MTDQPIDEQQAPAVQPAIAEAVAAAPLPLPGQELREHHISWVEGYLSARGHNAWDLRDAIVAALHLRHGDQPAGS